MDGRSRRNHRRRLQPQASLRIGVRLEILPHDFVGSPWWRSKTTDRKSQALSGLPIDDVLDDIVGALKSSPNLVIRAPPGAGKTTQVPGAILDAGIVAKGQRIVMLEPRRVAARAAARTIAKMRKTRLGGEVGYRVRFEDRTSDETRIVIVTEGLLVRWLQDDPSLDGIGAVILDEFHERSIHADLALAFCREIQRALRPELRIVVMSATLDVAPVAAYLGDCPVVTSEGRQYPVEKIFTDRLDDRRVEEQVAAAVKKALREDEGDVLAFLPGAAEIRRTCERLGGLGDVDVRPLYGALEAKAQDAAIEPGPRRKVVVATNIAESSLTIEGVRVVVDSGLEKIVRHDPSRGIDRLDTVRISRASAEQRAGRAGRLAPGRAYRLWTDSEDRRLAAAATPEIARVDLTGTVLEVMAWSGADPRELAWFESPPEPMVLRAMVLLESLGAVPPGGFALTDRGKKLRAFPLHPRIAAVMLAAHERGVVPQAALLAALASEPTRRSDRDRVGSSDLLAMSERPSHVVMRARDQIERTAQRVLRSWAKPGRREEDIETSLLRVVLAGFADRVAKRREPGSDRVVMVGGRGAKLAPECVVKEAELMVVVDVDDTGGRADSLVRSASAIEEGWLEGVHEVRAVRFNPERRAAEGVRRRQYRDLVLEEVRDHDADPNALSAVLVEAAIADLERAWSPSPAAAQLVLRIEFLRRAMPDLELPEMDRAALIEQLCIGRRSFADLAKADTAEAIRGLVGYTAMQQVNQHAPKALELGGKHPFKLRYETDGPPVLSARIQHLFGVRTTPRVAGGRVPVKVELLAPNMRPAQVTQDLENFWQNTYLDVRKQLRARYPKHAWPEKP